MVFDIADYPDAQTVDETTRWVIKDGKPMRQVYVTNSAGTGWLDQPYRLTFTEELTVAEVGLIISALYIVAGESEDSAEASYALADRLLAMELHEDDRVSLEVARASFMTKSERLEDMRKLFLRIGQQALPPSQYRKENQREIGRILAMVRTITWKEGE